MKREVYVVQTAAHTALGLTLNETWERLCASESAIKPIKRFDIDRLECKLGACVPDSLFSNSENRLCSLLRKPLTDLTNIPENTFVIWTGIKNNIDYIEKRENRDGLYLAQHLREWVCTFLGLKNMGTEVNAACASSTVGLALATQMIESGEHSSVLVVGADMVSRFTHTGFSALRALSPVPNKPFDNQRKGLTLGDCAAAILLTDKTTASANSLPLLGKVTGWGIANDANHITGPAKDGRGLVKAINSALKQGEHHPDTIEAFCAHGTGTVYNDAMELTALEKVFGARRFPLFSVKGALGHTLGAAGALESILSIRAMMEKKIPPTLGLEDPEERAKGRATTHIQEWSGKNILTTNSGFGGCNAALLFERA